MNSDQNPYQVPQADVALALIDGKFHEPRTVPSGNGNRWLSDAWRLFKVSPGMWIAMLVVYAVCQIVISIVPLAGTIFGPVFMAGFYRASQTAAEEGVVRLEDIFSGFRERLGPLILVGLLTLAFIIGIVLVCALIGVIGVGLTNFDIENVTPAAIGLILIFALVVAALILPIMMMGWFAPALVAFQGMGPFEAMKCSFRACLRNVLPFTLYGFVGLLLLLAGLIPMGLGLIVVFPVLLLSFYTSYHDIFIAND